jgi:hypothetical protein
MTKTHREMTQDELNKEIHRIERLLEDLKDRQLQLRMEESKANAGFKEGDIVYVYEYCDEKHGGRWHPVKAKGFFTDPHGKGSLGFTFVPNDKQGKNLMRWRQAYICHGNVRITEPTAAEAEQAKSSEYNQRQLAISLGLLWPQK